MPGRLKSPCEGTIDFDPMHSDNERWYFRFDHPWLIFLRPFATIKGEFDETEDQLSAVIVWS
jgi:hypothetical protein